MQLIDRTPLTKPEWMTQLPKSQMSNDQLRQLESYERKEKDRLKKVDDRINELEFELKRRKSNIVDFTLSFNERLFLLQKERINALNALTHCDIYSVTLANGIFLYRRS